MQQNNFSAVANKQHKEKRGQKAPLSRSNKGYRLEGVLHTQCPVVDLAAPGGPEVPLDVTQVGLGALAQAVSANDLPDSLLEINVIRDQVTVSIKGLGASAFISLTVGSIDQVVTETGGTTDKPGIGTITDARGSLTSNYQEFIRGIIVDQCLLAPTNGTTIPFVLTEDGELVEAPTTTDLPGIVIATDITGDVVSEDQEATAFPVTTDTPWAIRIRIELVFILDSVGTANGEAGKSR